MWRRKLGDVTKWVIQEYSPPMFLFIYYYFFPSILLYEKFDHLFYIKKLVKLVDFTL